MAARTWVTKLKDGIETEVGSGAHTLTPAQAQQLANDDVQAGQRQYQARYRGGQSDMGAMVGGIILGNILSGGMRGGFGGGGWTSTSYGGSQDGGGLLGGGGRF